MEASRCLRIHTISALYEITSGFELRLAEPVAYRYQYSNKYLELSWLLEGSRQIPSLIMIDRPGSKGEQHQCPRLAVAIYGGETNAVA